MMIKELNMSVEQAENLLNEIDDILDWGYESFNENTINELEETRDCLEDILMHIDV